MASLFQIEQFTSQKHIAVVGISRTPHKFGNNAYKELKSKGYTLYPISKNMTEFEGNVCYSDIKSLPEEVSAVLICTKPEQTKLLLEESRAKGIKHIWLQQGAADRDTILRNNHSSDNVITNQCILMYAKPTHFMHRTHAFFKRLFGQYPS